MRAALVAIAAAAALAALLFARPHPTPGPPMRDFEAYYAAGQTWNAGADPYSLAIWNGERELQGVGAAAYAPLPFVNPPATLALFSVIARLPFAAANALWRAVMIAFGLALGWIALRLLRVPLAGGFVPVVIAGLGFGPITSAIALGQIALPACAFAALALLWKPAGLLAWVQPNVALTMLSQCARRNGAIAIAAGAAAFAAACVALAGLPQFASYVRVVREHGNAERFSAIQITPAAIAYGFGASEATAIAAGIAVAIAAVAVWFTFVRRIEDEAARYCATCALLPPAMPFFHEHDLAVLFLPALYFTVRCPRTLWPLACAAALFCATDWLGLAQRPDGTLQTLLLVAAAGCALAALRRDLDARMLLAPAGVVLAILCAATLAHAHPAPVWPDAMHAPVAPQATIAATWHAEQQAAGLFARDAEWALLRSLSLLGCAALAVSGVVMVRQAHHDIRTIHDELPCHPEPVEG